MTISRRRLFGGALAAGATGLAGTSLAACAADRAAAPGADLRAGAGANTTLGPVKQIDAGVLNVGYAEFGPATGQPVVLLHGWPYDPYSYADVGPLLAAAGYRVIVPYLRGYGSTTFLSDRTVRNGQQTAIARDIVDLMDALHIDRAVLGGFDWGARTVDVIAALWPQRCKAIVSVSGYLVTQIAANQQPLAPEAELGWWYQYYFATERGRLGYSRNRREFNKLIWRRASPQWNFDDATYERSAAAFDNPDHVDIVIHNYRWRLGLAPGEPEFDAYERQLDGATVTVPAITVSSDFDGAAKDGKSYRGKFAGKYEHRVLDGIGHNVPQEAPRPFAQAVIDADHL
ncbi:MULTISPECIES: alpha/beta fold hydrolase [Nocardia]|uniref:Alpha/beta hydrolase n=1 Tax=Nocardia implantans TaxID=3108168 RepID=A0ABU6B4N9_9NOCA|nr:MULTISPECIES: alpha/beta hydrolase [unclassified Nocardia]MBF6195989.1 alpha/beta hydrolase [Nocardia beijingensis]MEA3532276.1 alpha/beta hydrolase [Nocardia sp. CDC192]MEB3514329.1 alpha/beta hydrolase [Nocardia sp. CDC186]